MIRRRYKFGMMLGTLFAFFALRSALFGDILAGAAWGMLSISLFAYEPVVNEYGEMLPTKWTNRNIVAVVALGLALALLVVMMLMDFVL